MSPPADLDSPTPWFFAGPGVTPELARQIAWETTPLGPCSGWPTSLKSTLAMLFHASQPMFLWWGPALIQFYNDAYLPSFGRGKHPAAMGQPGRECWQEIWPIIWPQIDDVMARGKASWHQDALVPIERNGRIEEVYWTYSYGPIYSDDGSIGGTLVICTETTARVLAERRMRTLRALADRTALATDLPALLHHAAAALADNNLDIPCAALLTADTVTPILPLPLAPSPSTAALPAALLAPTARLVPLASLPLTPIPAPWPEPPTHAWLAPLAGPEPHTLLALGLSPRLPFDDPYRHFLAQVLEHLDSARTRITAEQSRLAAQRERDNLLSALAAANRTKDEFLAMLGHELRNPLAPIVTALQLMTLQSRGDPSREYRVIERQVAHLVRLVDDLLDVARITRGQIDLHRETVAIADVLTRAIEMASHLLEKRGHRLDLDLPPEPLLTDGDPVRLAQIVANLLTNAARYTEPGGHICLRARQTADHIELRVQDDGIGIPPEMLPRMFDLFVQGQRSSDRADGGLGIGLALVKNLVALHGGTVTAHSDGPGRGSEFILSLPLAAHTHPTPLAQNPAIPTPPRNRVLVVDDNVDAAEILGDLLRFHGYQVALAHDALAALALLPRFRPDAAILDIGLPVIDGHELAARIRADPNNNRCRLIALSGYGQAHDAPGTPTTFERHLIKPVDIDVLVDLLAQAP